ncbi:bifunctional 3-deoxy-7-phosphoheptulonate synthase/chorismate mutase type II [Caldinitratiruptor microaerophilus]|uniref:Chorismate mutase domain-containing protein n=1 Tax=Caldinitratiruptor microaerophilus TaxID=671077 RepID=A0AA35CQU5_9FIRM|nr:bifunctional 3-deoxy-7-phosphoheptulonate synthase/chorismate mutase type II [Caldinitratiruptor microaerophilus]BDG62125.1 hypothetical protein caldi_32150 [Caldinitratiruptor microaerophilus]
MGEAVALRVREGAGTRKRIEVGPGLWVGGERPAVLVATPVDGEVPGAGGRAAAGGVTRRVRLLAAAGFPLVELRPGSSPYGPAPDPLDLVRAAREGADVALAFPVTDPAALTSLEGHVDAYRVPPAHMQNFRLLRALGAVRTPVLLSRGPAATIEEWLLAAEYVLAGGNDRVILCETGVLTAGGGPLPVPDLAAALEAARQTALPVLLDVSYVPHPPGPLVRAALAAGIGGAVLRVERDADPDLLAPLLAGAELGRGASLPAVRRAIDATDRVLLAALADRMRLAARAGTVKARLGLTVYQPEREQQLVEALVGDAREPLGARAVRAIWREILRASREVQQPVGPAGSERHRPAPASQAAAD